MTNLVICKKKTIAFTIPLLLGFTIAVLEQGDGKPDHPLFSRWLFI